MNWLIALSVTMPPIAAILAVEFFLFRSAEFSYDKLPGMKGIRPITYIGWAAAAAFGFLTHFKVLKLTTASVIDALIVAVVLHFILMLAAGNKIRLPNKA
jgi:cytosine permease